MHRLQRHPALIVAAIGAMPLLIAHPAPLWDWPSHLARVHIEAALLRGDPFWSQFYVLRSFFVPNVALDAVLLGLFRLGIGETLAAQLFLVALYVWFVTAFAWLARAVTGCREPLKPLLAAALFYTEPFFYGLVNYMLGVAVALAVLAAWHQAELTATRRVIVLAGVPLAFFCHLIAAAALIATLAAVEAVQAIRARSLRGIATPFACVVLAIMMAAAPHDHGFHIRYYFLQSASAYVRWKLLLFPQLALGSSAAWERLGLAGAAAIAVSLAAAARLRLPLAWLVAISVLVLLVFASPDEFQGGALLDERLVLMPVTLAAACVTVSWRARWASRSAVALAALIVLGRTALLAATWRSDSAIYADFDGQAAGAPIATLFLRGFGLPPNHRPLAADWRPPILHMDSIAVRHGDVTPGVFANPAQQPIERQPLLTGLGVQFDMTSAAAARRSLVPVAPMCARTTPPIFPRVYMLLRFPAPAGERLWLAPALLHDGPSFQIIDICALIRTLA